MTSNNNMIDWLLTDYHTNSGHDLTPWWLPRVFTGVTIQTGLDYKRNSSSLVLLSLVLRFTNKDTNIITLIYPLLPVRCRMLLWR